MENLIKINESLTKSSSQLKIVIKRLEVLDKNIETIRYYMIENDIKKINILNYNT